MKTRDGWEKLIGARPDHVWEAESGGEIRGGPDVSSAPGGDSTYVFTGHRHGLR